MKLKLALVGIGALLILGWLVYRDSVWTKERVERSAEIEVQQACSKWKVNRSILTNKVVTDEGGNNWSVRFSDAKETVWVEVAFSRLGGVETFTNLNPTVSNIEKQLKKGVAPKDIKH